jgi:hypothetical protein
MDIQQAQKISLVGYVASLGFKPVAAQKGRLKCQSPFRPEETEPSFYLFYNKEKGKWQWKDFGLNEKGGDIIDFIMKLYNVSEMGALMILDSPELSISTFSSFIGNSQNNPKPNIEIKHIQPLQNVALVQYLNSRKISQAKAVNYVQECYYHAYPGQTKAFFALCWQNIKQGYELHNAKRKKYISGNGAPTIIKGTNKAANIFESMTDFLSALEHYRTTKPTGTCIVLNSVSNLDTIINTLEQYEQINLYLDNDNAGNQAAETIKRTHPKVKDYAKIIYPNNKDFNEFLTAGNPAQINKR